MPEISLTVLVLLCLAALLAGWIDAVVGGGGLLLLPALLLGLPHVPHPYVLGTNKAVAIVGTTGAAVTYVRRAPVQVWTAVRVGLAALAGSTAGALFVSAISRDVIRPLLMAVLVAVALFVMLRPPSARGPRGRSGRRSPGPGSSPRSSSSAAGSASTTACSGRAPAPSWSSP